MVFMKLNTNSFTCYVYPKASIDSKIYSMQTKCWCAAFTTRLFH